MGSPPREGVCAACGPARGADGGSSRRPTPDRPRRHRPLRIDDAAPAAGAASTCGMAFDVERDIPKPDLALGVLKPLSVAASHPAEGGEGVPEALRGLPFLGALPPWLLASRQTADRRRRPRAGIEPVRRRTALSPAPPAPPAPACQGHRMGPRRLLRPHLSRCAFISLRRDPRAVVSSWIKAGWLDTTSPPDSDDWQWGEVHPALLELWEELGGGPCFRRR